MEKQSNHKNNESSSGFYLDLDKKTKYQGNCSCLSMVVFLILVGVVIFFIFSYFYLNK